MPDDAPYTRREGDQLARRVEGMDEHGTRGMQLLGERVSQQSRAIADLAGQVADRFAEHTRQHDAEQKERTARRRWLITAAIAAAASVAAVLSLLLTIIAQLAHR